MPSIAPFEQFDTEAVYQDILRNEAIAAPLVGILVLTKLIESSRSGTTFELVREMKEVARVLSISNPITLNLGPAVHTASAIGVNAGCELFIEFVTLFPHETSSFADLKRDMIRQGNHYVQEALSYRSKIAELVVDELVVQDDAVPLIPSAGLALHGLDSDTLVFASRYGSIGAGPQAKTDLRIKTAELLTAAGIPSAVILDSAVAYVMDKVDLVLVGSEAVVESGGLINAVGSNQIAIIAKAANKPFYALAESYKFHRLFPLSQYDLPSHNPGLLAFTDPRSTATSKLPGAVDVSIDSEITQQRILQNNPDVDYTRPDLISQVFSDVGSLTPEGVSQYLVGMFAG